MQLMTLTWMVSVSLMETQDSTSGHLLQLWIEQEDATVDHSVPVKTAPLQHLLQNSS